MSHLLKSLRRLRRPLAGLLLACGLTGMALAQHTHSGAGSARKRPPPLAIATAIAPDGQLWVVSVEPGAGLTVRRSADEGRQWSPTQTVDTGTDKIAADGESRPKLAFGPNGLVVIAYTQPLARPYTGEVRMVRSVDGGKTFSTPQTVHADRQEITHRFESIAFDASGALHTVWIDKRDLEAQRAAARGADRAQGTARTTGAGSYRGAAIYRNVSTDGGITFGPDTKVADYSCECCRIAVAPSPDGGVVALWRHIFAPNERDHAFAALSGPPVTAPVRATLDRWAVNACPHHGPGLAPARGGGYHAVWFGQRNGTMGARLGRLQADGSATPDVRPLPDGAEHAAIAATGAQLAVVWRRFDGQATQWEAWVSSDGGAQFERRSLRSTRALNDHPLLAQHHDRILAVWRTEEGIHVVRLTP